MMMMDRIKRLLSQLLAVIAAAGTLVLFILFGTLMGALSGWIVGWFFSDSILTFFAAFGVTGITMWQIGASLGFLSGYLKKVKIG